MIVTEEVQKAMQGQNPQLGAQRMAQGPRLAACHAPGDDDFAEKDAGSLFLELRPYKKAPDPLYPAAGNDRTSVTLSFLRNWRFSARIFASATIATVTSPRADFGALRASQGPRPCAWPGAGAVFHHGHVEAHSFFPLEKLS